ncbi:expressed protein [Phakopsora pachyrhizi]|uniref:Expressed protein n=1 Tax=Phakopsora pachyrhizi TaxID=170000 RepID=A0AAV0AYN7_PHAPC|nr:expressed protein [Phakopsora pachyrhizi]CAH7690022.1 expressed protein [Phakopsora pachyrhizi]
MSEKKSLNTTAVQISNPPQNSSNEATKLRGEIMFFNLARAAVLAAPPIIFISFVVELIIAVKPILDNVNIFSLLDPDNPINKIAGFVQKRLQLEVDVTDIIVTIGLVVFSFVITTILNITLIPLLFLTSRVVKRAATFIGLDALFTTASTVAAIIVVSTGEAKVSIRNTKLMLPSIINTIASNQFGFSQKYSQITIIQRIVTSAIVISGLLTLSYILEFFARRRALKTNAENTAMV